MVTKAVPPKRKLLTYPHRCDCHDLEIMTIKLSRVVYHAYISRSNAFYFFVDLEAFL